MLTWSVGGKAACTPQGLPNSVSLYLQHVCLTGLVLSYIEKFLPLSSHLLLLSKDLSSVGIFQHESWSMAHKDLRPELQCDQNEKVLLVNVPQYTATSITTSY